MKSFQSLSAALLLSIVFAACGNDSSDTTGAGTADTTAAAVANNDNAAGGNQEKLEENKKLVSAFLQSLYGDKDSTAIDKYVADDIKTHNPLLQDGKPWLRNVLRPFLENPNIQKTKVDVKHMAAEGDKVWVLIREVAPNGQVFARAEIFRIENGKIAENWLVTQAEPKKPANSNTMF